MKNCFVEGGMDWEGINGCGYTHICCLCCYRWLLFVHFSGVTSSVISLSSMIFLYTHMNEPDQTIQPPIVSTNRTHIYILLLNLILNKLSSPNLIWLLRLSQPAIIPCLHKRHIAIAQWLPHLTPRVVV